MEVKTLNSSNTLSLSANYGLDDNVVLTKSARSTYHGLNFTLDDCLSSIRDTSINNYSSFYLSDDVDYNSFLYLNNLSIPANYTFTTYLQVNTVYLNAVSNDPYPYSTLTFVDELNSNTTYFEINFLDDKNCKIKHTENELTRYISYDYINSQVILLTGTDVISDNDINTFQYYYDVVNDNIIFTKKIYDKTTYLTCNFNSLTLALSNISTTQQLSPCLPTQIFKVRINASTISNKLSTSNYVYTESLDTTKLIVDTNKSTGGVKTNFLYNTQYYNINPYISNSFDVNILSLKTQKTVYNTQSQGNVFVNQPAFKHRYYESLYTGVNQETGNANIQLGFASYTLTKQLNADTLTYFHIPFDIYPYEKLNVNDTSLVVSGAIASDTPYYSDKIFKRLQNGKYDTHFGNVSDTQTGSFLCTWLSGGPDINSSGVWVDRYYNPANISYYQALVNPSVGLTTNFAEISSSTGNDNIAYDIYDVTSNLVFEKGALYAYHHIGNNNCKSFVDGLSSKLIVDNFDYYFTTTYDRKVYTNEIVFNYDHFAKVLDTPLDSVSQFDNFSISFDISTDNWLKPFGSQILGNYTNKGFGVFNTRQITPYSVVYNDNKITLYNTHGTFIRDIYTENTIIGIQQFEPNSYFIVFDNKGYVTKYSYIGTALDKKYISELVTADDINFYSFNNYTFILINENWYRLNPDSFELESSDDLNYSTIKVGADSFKGIAVKDSSVYLLSGSNVKVYGDEIYFYTSPELYYYNITNQNFGIKAIGEIQDYVFDPTGNCYCLVQGDKIATIDTLDNFSVVELSSLTGFTRTIGRSIDLINEFYGDEYITDYLSIYSLSSNNVLGRPAYIRCKTDLTNPTTTISGTTGNAVDYSNINNINNHNYIINNYGTANTIDVKIKLPNIYDVQTYETGTLTYPLSNLSPGYHNFTITFDTTVGVFNLYVDGKNVSYYLFDPGKYSFGTIFDNSLYIGTEASYGSNKLNDNLKDTNYYNYGKFKMKNLYMYNEPLYLYDIANLIRTKYKIENLLFEIPTGKRSYVETIDKFYMNKLPGRKSNLLNISIQDTGITELALQENISTDIYANINKVLPANTKLNNIVWEKDNG